MKMKKKKRGGEGGELSVSGWKKEFGRISLPPLLPPAFISDPLDGDVAARHERRGERPMDVRNFKIKAVLFVLET
ncbi:hypothetical protein INR49_021838 [Caranx melampygus]|nr:hypothetical protein INR49_021838 [Caranx melampygus]